MIFTVWFLIAIIGLLACGCIRCGDELTREREKRQATEAICRQYAFTVKALHQSKSSDTVRKEFEEWMLPDQLGNMDVYLRRNNDGDYIERDTSFAWHVWKAAQRMAKL